MDELDRRLARRWILLAASSLVLAGTLAMALVVARTPALDRLVGDPLFFKRALVVHVDLSIVVWFHAFTAGLFALLPSRAPRSVAARAAPAVAAIAVVLLVVAAAIPGAKPILSNYVPTIDHPLFGAGLALFGLALAMAVLDPRIFPANEKPKGPVAIPEEARPGLRAAALALLAALATFFASWLGTDRAAMAPEAYYETLFWGGGHVLQFASVAAMVACWILLLTPVLGKAPLSRRESTWVFALLLLPALSGPLLALQETTSGAYRLSFMRLMQWGIFPSVTLAFALCVRTIVRERRQLPRGFARDGRFIAFATSATLTALGFGLGAMIRSSTTLVPAHYHAAIGAVTAIFMGTTWVLLAPLGMPIRSLRHIRLARVQPAIFGFGQAVFALGFALAGAHGMGRKTYGAEQLGRTLPQSVGLVVMGVGGLVAVAGGLTYLWIVTAAARAARISERSEAWTLANGSTPSRG